MEKMGTALIESAKAGDAVIGFEERRVGSTVRRICEAARSEFAVRGLDQARMSDIADRAGVTKQLIYYHFGSKEGLYVAVIDDNTRNAIRCILADEYDSLTPADAMRKLLLNMVKGFSESPLRKLTLTARSLWDDMHRSTRIVARSGAARAMKQAEAILARGAQDGSFQKDVDVRLFFGAGVSAVYGCFMTDLCMRVIVGNKIATQEGGSAWAAFIADMLLSTIDPKGIPHPYAQRASLSD